PDADGIGPDSGTANGGEQSPDAAADASVFGSIDGGLDGAVPLTAEAFCDLQLGRARAWLDYFESKCDCASQEERADRDYFLAAALLYDDSSGANCITAVTGLQQRTTVSYQALSAASCAQRFAGQFAEPPGDCNAGFALDAYEALLGHGLQQIAQLPECRATFLGKVGVNGACVDAFDCTSGLRCLPLPGSAPGDVNAALSCQSARGDLEPCGNRSDCADGLVCAHSDSSATGSNCIPANDLRQLGGPCRASRDCDEGLVCSCPSADCSTGECVAASASEPICKP
ncbi:MAG TPA: hypothetical protein VG963_32815, partial [Polyangiaceae bacterium]|nr:hypothetical protein [Polyangiaceae bacterium]